MRALLHILIFLLISSATAQNVIVLGVAQDGGFPHIGCQAECQKAHDNPKLARFIVSLALVDPASKKWWLFEATPDMDKQLQYFRELTDSAYPYLPEGIFLTHAHMGHYTGLMFLGREALGANGLDVHVLPKMANFLQSNGPWSQLVELENIQLKKLGSNQITKLNDRIEVEAFTVPHRDEFSETAGFRIKTESFSYLFIPDIDKWEKWNKRIVDMVKDVDHAFLDATFYADGELPNRAMSEVPHPFVSETMKLFGNETEAIKSKIKFIHFNHTNPLLFDQKTRKKVKGAGFEIAQQGQAY